MMLTNMVNISTSNANKKKVYNRIKNIDLVKNWFCVKISVFPSLFYVFLIFFFFKTIGKCLLLTSIMHQNSARIFALPSEVTSEPLSPDEIGYCEIIHCPSDKCDGNFKSYLYGKNNLIQFKVTRRSKHFVLPLMLNTESPKNHPLLDSIIHKLNIKPVIFMNLDSIERFFVLSFTIVYVSPSLNIYHIIFSKHTGK
ncbi:hypothetical protein AGLY_001064 [Aphis glycines]|uniref:Uncharacterized protein n=1 Tax=Aphis glycines TaxID=307491 RepID=A0A6G0U8R6_APHGL|nr:hypothetical protein AGLY_001064 [Aphis glycines]